MQDTEFKNKAFQTLLKQHQVHHFVTYSETKAQVVERFSGIYRTVKDIIHGMLRGLHNGLRDIYLKSRDCYKFGRKSVFLHTL